MKKVLVLIPVLVLLVAFLVGAVSTASAAVEFSNKVCFYIKPVNDNCLWRCCYPVRGGELTCTPTRICLH